jgi:hypothetical protein
MDPYWAWQWRMDYSFGFARRSLLGFALYPILQGPYEYEAIHFLGFWVTTGLALLVGFRLNRLLQPSRDAKFALCALLFVWAPSLWGVVYECMGDPIQLILLIFLILAPIASRQKNDSSSGWILGCMVAGFVFSLIHEAQIFFTVAPLIAIWLIKGRRGVPAFGSRLGWAYVGGSLVGIALVTLFGQSASAWAQSAASFTLHLTPTRIVSLDPNLFPSFHSLVVDEKIQDFGFAPQLKNYVIGSASIVIRAVSVIAFPLAVSLVFPRIFISGDLGGKSVTYGRWYLVSLGLMLPLLVIAHDWGRFAGYSLCSIIVLSSLEPSAAPEPLPIRLSFWSQMGATLIAAGCICGPAVDYFRLSGLTAHPRYFLVSGYVFAGVGAVIIGCVHRAAKRGTFVGPE